MVHFDIADILWKVLTPIFTLIVGILLERFKSKTIILEKSYSFQNIAFSINNPQIGHIEILYNGGNSQCLSSVTVEIVNNSTKNITNFILDVSVNEGYYIYRESAFIEQRELTKSLELTPKYLNRRQFVNDNWENVIKPNSYENELSYIVRHRQFDVPVLNKKSKLVLTILADGPTFLDNLNVGIFVENVDLIFKRDAESERKLRTSIISIIASIVYIITAFPIIHYSKSITDSVYLMLANSGTCYLFAWAGYFLFNFFRSFFRK